MSKLILPSGPPIPEGQAMRVTPVFPVAFPERRWNKNVQIYVDSGTVPVVRGCFAFMFTNVGAVIGFVDQMVVFPSATPATALGDSRTLSGHLFDLYAGTIDLKFNAGAGAAIEIVQLFYIL